MIVPIITKVDTFDSSILRDVLHYAKMKKGKKKKKLNEVIKKNVYSIKA